MKRMLSLLSKLQNRWKPLHQIIANDAGGYIYNVIVMQTSLSCRNDASDFKWGAFIICEIKDDTFFPNNAFKLKKKLN